jgi:hypothetical protein
MSSTIIAKIGGRLPPSFSSLELNILHPISSCCLKVHPEGFHLPKFPDEKWALLYEQHPQLHGISINVFLSPKEEEGTQYSLLG